MITRRSALAEDFITGGQDTIGIRVPDHVVALALLESFESIGGRGIAAPSANRFGHVSPTTAEAVAEELGEYLNSADQIIDGGACTVGVESTIIDCTGDAPRILRPGAITVAMIERSTGRFVIDGGLTHQPPSANQKNLQPPSPKSHVPDIDNSAPAIRVSGSFETHYAPAAKVFLCEIPTAGQGFIALASIETPPGVNRLASPRNDEEFAQILYSALRLADVLGLTEVVVTQPIGIGIAVAIRDRLRRASNGR